MIDIQRDLNILFFKKKKRKKEKKSGFDNIMEEIIYTFAHWRDTITTIKGKILVQFFK